MEEQVVTFKTAMMARQKGFNEECRKIYEFNKDNDFELIELEFEDYETTTMKNTVVALMVTAPTQSLLQKWLREKHDIHINIFRNEDGHINYTYKFDNPYERSTMWFSTYEKALEEGLYKALQLIKD